MTAEERNRERVYALGRQGQMPFLPTAKQLLLASIPRVYRNDAPVKRFCKACGALKPVSEFHSNGVYNGKPMVHQPCKDCMVEAKIEIKVLPPPTEFRQCTKCKQDYDLSQFRVYTRQAKSLSHCWCRSCESQARSTRKKSIRKKKSETRAPVVRDQV